MHYLMTHPGAAWALTVVHLRLSLLPVLIGLMSAVPLGLLVQRAPLLRRLTTATASVIFTIPSLALFVVLPLIIGTRILDEANVIVALAAYTTALLVRAVLEALDAVPAQVHDAATAIGYSRIAQMLKVELPLSIPVLVAGLRVVAVTNIAMVSVGSVIGIGGLGTWFTAGYQTNKSDQIVAGVVAMFLLAIVVDVVINLAGRLATPWERAPRAARRRRQVAAPDHGRSAMNFLQQALSYLLTASNWTGPVGLAVRTCEHLEYTAVAVAASALIAVPVGLLIGHTGRGTLLVVGAVNGLRALPTLGVLLLGVLLFGLGLGPPLVALMLLGIPSLLASTYAGIASVDPLVVDAARAMGMTESQVLLRVEVPNALPLMLGGLRSATLQVVATATVAAYASLGGLGGYLIDGIKERRFHIALVGAMMVAALALTLDGLLALAGWVSVPGTGRMRKLAAVVDKPAAGGGHALR